MMSQRKAIYTTTPAFPEPNYTQTPNNFFDMLPDMEASEIIVTLIMIRNTFGFHRTNFKMGIKKLEDATGLSRNSVKAGAEAAEKRGTFRRTNPEEQGEAEWELVVGQSLPPLNESPLVGQPLTPSRSTIDPQVGIKESIKKDKEIKNTKPDFSTLKPSEYRKIPELKTFIDATGWIPGSFVIQTVYDLVSAGLTYDKIKAAFDEWTARGYKPANVKGYLTWARDGIPAPFGAKQEDTGAKPAVNTVAVEATKKLIESKWDAVKFVPNPMRKAKDALSNASDIAQALLNGSERITE